MKTRMEARITELEKELTTANNKLIDCAVKISELEKQLTAAEKVVLSYDMSFKERDIRDLEQQAKGIKDFFALNKPYIQMGEEKMWRVDNVIVDEFIAGILDQTKALGGDL